MRKLSLYVKGVITTTLMSCAIVAHAIPMIEMTYDTSGSSIRTLNDDGNPLFWQPKGYFNVSLDGGKVSRLGVYSQNEGEMETMLTYKNNSITSPLSGPITVYMFKDGTKPAILISDTMGTSGFASAYWITFQDGRFYISDEMEITDGMKFNKDGYTTIVYYNKSYNNGLSQMTCRSDTVYTLIGFKPPKFNETKKPDVCGVELGENN